MDAEADPGAGAGGRPLRKSTLAAALLLYAAALAAATYPVALGASSRLPCQLADPLMHLWVLRWDKSCALEGRLPFDCPGIQYPVGASLGRFSPMHLQALLYLPLSAVTSNDILIYNFLWFGGFLFTGTSVFLLARGATRDDASAWLGGLLAMLAGPMMVHSNAHLELIYAGGFSAFLAAWVGFVDGPSRRRLLASAGLLILMTTGAAYYLVLAVPPSAFYVLWRLGRVDRGDRRAWLGSRARWIAGFAALVLPPLALLFSGQIWAVAHGDSMRREFSQFAYYKATLWGYFVPTPLHALGKRLPVDLYARTGHGGTRLGEGASYLGLVAVGLLVYAAVRRVKFPRSGYWWGALGLLVVLSLGASCELGGRSIPLPGRWLWDYVPVFQLTRNPARFNLLACQCAAVVAAAGLSSLLARIDRQSARLGLVAGLAVLAVLDLRVSSLTGIDVPPMPGYHRGLASLPGGLKPALLEAPMVPSGSPAVLTSACGYWQSVHGARTSAGYSGHDNDRFNEHVYYPSPVGVWWLRSDAYKRTDLDRTDVGVVRGVNVRDYAWLYARVHRFDRVVVHDWPGADADFPVGLDRLKAVFRQALVTEGDGVTVYDPERFGPPSRPLAVPDEGWRFGVNWSRFPDCPVAKSATLAAFDPQPGAGLVVTVEASALARPRAVRLLADGREVAAWSVAPGPPATYRSPTFGLPPGVRTLEIRSDGEDAPPRRLAIAEGDDRPYSLLVRGVRLERARLAGGVNPAGAPTASASRR